MSILSKAIYRCNRIPIKIPMVYFTEVAQISKIYMEPKKTQNIQNNLKNIKLYYYTNQNSLILAWKHTHIDHGNGREITEINQLSIWSINLWQRWQEFTIG